MIKEFRNLAFVGIDQPKGVSSQTLSVYPNPANDFTTLEFSNDFMGATYTIYSFTGEVIAESNINSTSVRVDCSAYAAGNYFVKATTAKGTITKTFVVQ
jgi:hypothetical protein